MDGQIRRGRRAPTRATMRMRSALGERLQSARRLAKLTQREASRKLDITERTLSSWETGDTEPNVSAMPRIAALYGCDLSTLMGVAGGAASAA